MKVQNYITILAAALLLLSCGGKSQETEQTEELVKTVNIITKTVTPSTFASYLRVVGTVEASNDIMISAEVNGKMIEHKVAEGAIVRKGQIIAKIDDAKLKQEKVRLEAMTSQSKEQYDRLKKVYEEDGIGSELDYLNAKYAYEQSNSSLESIKIDLENTNIRAPFNGEVESIVTEEGEMVSSGMEVVRLIGSNIYKITAGVPARYSEAVNRGDKVAIWFDSQVKDTLHASISYVGGSINPENRTFRIETELPTERDYKVGMIANLRLKTYEQEKALVLSEEFVYSKNNKYVVYVLSENEEGKATAKEQEVTLGLAYQGGVIIESGLTAGDKLITLGSAFLDDGMRVTVKKDQNLASN